MPLPRSDDGLAAVDVHRVLSNERRRMTLQILREADDSVSVRQLSERIAELETGKSPPPRNIRRSAYISLVQSHLPKLHDLDVVDYDATAKSIRLGDDAEQVYAVMPSERTAPPDEYYLLISAIGLALLLVTKTVGPSLDPLPGLDPTAFPLVVVAGLAAYRTMKNGWPLLRRLRETYDSRSIRDVQTATRRAVKYFFSRR